MNIKKTYESPTSVIIETEPESVMCSSLNYGDEGSAGDDLIGGDDILDYGGF